MRNLLFILASFCFSCLNVFGQSFAPVGAEWYYVKWLHSNNNPPYSTDFILVRCTGDTVIDGRTCSILQCYNNGISKCDSSGMIVYGDSNEIGFCYKSDFSTRKFWPVMRFNVQPGDTVTGYTYTGAYSMPRCYPINPELGDIDSFQYVVAAVSSISVSGKMLKKISLEFNFNSYEPYVDVRPPLIYHERIGSMREKFFIESTSVQPGGWAGYLRCYKDHEITYKTQGVTALCDAYAVSQIHDPAPIHIFPNPAQYQITIQNEQPWPTDTRFELYNVLGQPVLSEQAGSFTQQTIDVQSLPAGTYLMLVHNKELSFRQKVLITR